MKRIILTESQYKRLVKKPLNEQNVIFDSGYDWEDVKTFQMINILGSLTDSIFSNFNENLYVKSIDGDKVVIDFEKYDEIKRDEIKKYIIDEFNREVTFTDNPDDNMDDEGNIDFSFDSEPLDDEEKEINVNIDTNYSDDTMGFKTGGVDSRLAMVGGTGNNWNGSMPRALSIAKMIHKEFNVVPSSQKRRKKQTENGSTSQHYFKNFDSYAVDLPTGTVKKSSSKDNKGDKMFNMIVDVLGQPNTTSGKWLNIIYDGYKYNIGWRVKDHYNHIHVGVKKN